MATSAGVKAGNTRVGRAGSQGRVICARVEAVSMPMTERGLGLPVVLMMVRGRWRRTSQGERRQKGRRPRRGIKVAARGCSFTNVVLVAVRDPDGDKVGQWRWRNPMERGSKVYDKKSKSMLLLY